MSSLLSKSLGQVRTQEQPTTGQQNRRSSSGATGGSGAGAGATGNRNSPYARPAEGSWKHDLYGKSDAAPAAAPRTARTDKSAKLQVSNVHYEVSERELEALFVQIGPIVAGPKIKFDRSGRSEGIAWVTYGNEDHASQAKQAFDGALAKGQELKVEFDYRLDKPSERGAPAPGTLLARLEAESNPRRGGKSSNAPRDAPRGPARGVGGASDRGAARGGRGAGRGGARRGRAPREPRVPKTTDDLDKELEAYLAVPAPAAVAAAPVPVAPATELADVEMA